MMQIRKQPNLMNLVISILIILALLALVVKGVVGHLGLLLGSNLTNPAEVS